MSTPFRIEDAVSDTHRLLESAVDAMTDGLLILDSAYRVRLTNHACGAKVLDFRGFVPQKIPQNGFRVLVKMRRGCRGGQHRGVTAKRHGPC